MNNSAWEEFCGGPLWNTSQLFDNWWPEFTPCFVHTICVWVPCGYVWLLLPYFLYDVNNKFSTNNLHLATLGIRRQTSPTSDPNTGKGRKIATVEDVPRGVITAVCLWKIILTSLLSVLSLIQLLFDLKDRQATAEVVASAVYLGTYIVVAIKLWYERVKGRNPMFVSFYFYSMNIILGVVPLYTWIITEDYRHNPGKFTIIVLSLVVNLLTFLLTFVPDSEWATKKGYRRIGLHPCPEAMATYPSKLLFLWMLKLMMSGFRREITADDIWDLNPRDKGHLLNMRFEKVWMTEINRVDKINRVHKHSFQVPLTENGTPQNIDQPRERIQNGYQQHNMLVHGKDTNLSAAAYYGGSDETTSLLLATGYQKQAAQNNSPSLVRALSSLFWKDAVVIFVQKIIADAFLYSNPLILGVLIERLQFPDEAKIWQSYVLSFGLVVTGLVKTLLFAHSMYRSAILGLHVKTVLVSAIYKKALTISSSAKKDSTVGEIVNLMSVDCQRLEDIITGIFFMYSTPVQFVFAIVILYYTIGLAVITGLALLLVTIPFNMWIGKQQKRIQDSLLMRKDQRIKIVNEILNGMKVLKLYAWEDEFKRKVEAVRSKEIKQLYKIAFLNFCAGLAWGMAPFLVGLVTFTTFVLIDSNNVLDPQKAFVSLALFNLIRVPLNFISTMITNSVQISVSVKRINKFLIKEDLNLTNTVVDPHLEYAISIKSGTFTWDTEEQPILKNISENISVGKLTAIVGQVGSGKSSLIAAILGEMEKLSGQVIINGKIAYVSQQAWIQNATVRDNILFGKKYMKQHYNKVIQICELQRDLAILEAGDQTEIGEKGINLSGGQKQRINLARAVYSDSDIYLFDDPLSAVDAHVGKAIFKNVVSSAGVLATKTRILVTHGIHWLPQADQILVMSKGVISERGSYEELISHNGPFAQFLQMHLTSSGHREDTIDEEEEDDGELQEVKNIIRTKLDLVTSDTGNTSGEETYNVTRPELRHRKHSTRFSEGSLSQPLLMHESLDLSMTMTSNLTQIHPVGGKLIIEEKLETGKVKKDVFITFANACGCFSIIAALLAYALNQGFLTCSSFFLTVWTEDELLLNATTRNTPQGKVRLNYYLAVYGGFFGTAQVLFFIVFNYLFWFRLVRAADRLHHLLLDRLFHAPMSFFYQTPIGRILNRFSKDMDTVDNSIPLILRDWLVTFTIIIVTLIVVLIQSPIFGAVLVPLMVFFYIIQGYYVRTSRQLKRIESITRSPIYVHFSESITGAAVIRSYQATERFLQESVQKVDKNQLYYFASQAAIRWLQLNMDMLANIIVLFAAIFQIISGGGGSDAGLSVSYALQISGTLAYMVRQICEFETNIVSVERLKEYSQVEQEAALEIPETRPSPSWPSKGEVTFTNYQTRYRTGLDLVLKGVNCHINGGEKVGIVGRTGAGKSSLTLCLFRIIEAVGGSITIDGINIADIGLHELRSKLTILPQDPVLFSGSLRMNIDPFEQYTDEQLWKALERSHLKKFVAAQASQLMYECGEEGSNLSVGQRQLVCLARSLLRRTKILILDEATAAIDIETDSLIQKTIREAFSDCTIIAIAHRLNTIMDYDRIIVMDEGVIAEFDTPQNLLNSRGIFYSMCKDSHLA